MIKPCPLCGGAASIHDPGSDKYWWRRYISCDDCPLNSDGGDILPMTEAEAITAWNTRKICND